MKLQILSLKAVALLFMALFFGQISVAQNRGDIPEIYTGQECRVNVQMDQYPPYDHEAHFAGKEQVS